jgi:hypothetical protein
MNNKPKFISLTEFLRIFSKLDFDKIPFNEFLKISTVKVGDRQIPLKQYAKEKQILSTDLRTLYKNIVNKNEYLTRFYETSLDPRITLSNPDPLSIQGEKPMKSKEMNNNQLVKYKNPIRNMHYHAILETTRSGFENNPSFLRVLKDLYNHLIIDYKIVTPSGIFYMNNGRLGSVFSSYYFRASIMNPYLVYSLNLSILKGTRIFTPTLGWTSYAYGFLECPDMKEYVGCDVIPSVCAKTQEFIQYRYPHIVSKIFCQPSENLAISRPFLTKYKSHFDVVFFSPPYYELELYPGKDQSTAQYTTYEQWLDQYWRQTIGLCYHVLKPGGTLCYILSGYGKNNEYDLLKDMNDIAKERFRLKRIENMYNKNVFVTADFHRETGEKIMFFVK